MKNFLKLAFAAALLLFGAASVAQAQSSCPAFTRGEVLTAGQWQACFDAKQNALGYTPINRAGDTMLGRLVIVAPTGNLGNLNLVPGSTPASPSNGDLWTSSSGLFVRINGSTVGPLISSATACATCAVTNATNIFTAVQKINLNAGSPPTILAGTLLQVSGVDATAARVEVAAFGSQAFFTSRASLGTAASPTALTSGIQIGGYNSYGYNGASWVGPAATFRCFAAETWTSAPHQGTYCEIGVTANGGSTLTSAIRVENDGGVTLPSGVTGGSKGAGTLNATGVYVGGVAIVAGGITALTGDGTASGPGSAALTLATVNANVGSFGSSTAIPTFTVNGKGLITAASTAAVIAPAGTLTGTTLASNVVTSSITTIGTLVAGAVPTTLLTGTVTNGQLANSSLTIGTTAISLGATASTLAGVTSYNKVAITAPASGSTLTILDGKTLTANNSITIAGTDATVMTFPSSSASIPGLGVTNAFTGANSFSGVTTWTGSLVVPMRTFTGSGTITVSATTDYFICVNKASGAATPVTLPSTPATGLTFLIKDCKGDAATNNITINPATGNIDNAGSYIISVNLGSVAVTYNGTQWLVN